MASPEQIEEFKNQFEAIEKDKATKEQLHGAIKILDKEGKGVLGFGVVKQVLNAIGMGLTDQEFEDVMSEQHLATPGQVTYDEFIKIML